VVGERQHRDAGRGSVGDLGKHGDAEPGGHEPRHLPEIRNLRRDDPAEPGSGDRPVDGDAVAESARGVDPALRGELGETHAASRGERMRERQHSNEGRTREREHMEADEVRQREPHERDVDTAPPHVVREPGRAGGRCDELEVDKRVALVEHAEDSGQVHEVEVGEDPDAQPAPDAPFGERDRTAHAIDRLDRDTRLGQQRDPGRGERDALGRALEQRGPELLFE